jgi:hypothetical protein
VRDFLFYRQLLLRIAAGIVRPGLVPKIPAEDAIVVGESADDAFNVCLQPRILVWIGQRRGAWALNPSRVVDAGNRWMLRAEARMRIPAGIEEHQQRTNVMLRGDGQKLIKALPEAGGILLPKQIMQKDAHGVHAHRFRPSEFGIDLSGIEGCLLPHLELIDSRLGDVIAAHEPRLLHVPRVRLLLSPACGLAGQCARV